MRSVSRNTPRTILITGATGFIGSRLANLALARGYSVKTLSRVDWDSAPAVPQSQRYFGTLPDQIPAGVMQGVDVVVHCAASVDSASEIANRVNVEGTVRLAELARAAGVENFIFLSSQSAKADAISEYGKTKFAAEQSLLKMTEPNVIILRPGLVTGDGGRGLFRRMSDMVQSLPVVPLLGGSSIVQPIHVDDLCEAIFKCDELSLRGEVLKLGDPAGVTLAEFLQAVALARLGQRKLMLPIPILPIEIAVSVTEKIGIPLPINSANLKGLKVVEKMETQADLDRLGLKLRALNEMVRDGVVEAPGASSNVRVLLIGAGRIGLVHALTLSRLKGVVLSGVVDPNQKAMAFLKGMGLQTRTFVTLDEALAATHPDAAVIATPPSTHLELARSCLKRGMAVLIEKPLAVHERQLQDYERLIEEFPAGLVQVGYVMQRNPQISTALEQLRAGDFGNVRGFTGITLLSFIQKPNLKRWEVTKKISGGGTLINSGGHVLSMIQQAFGDPLNIAAQSLKLFSSEVEDSMVLDFSYPDFVGRHFCSWSINGYPRQENKLIVQTDEGRLILTASVGVFIRNDGAVDITHQLDFDVGFNLAPDYAGAGFSTELAELKQSVLTKQAAPVDLRKAIEIERLLFKAYDVASETTTFKSIDQTRLDLLPQTVRLWRDELPQPKSAGNVQRVLDLRDLSSEDVAAYFQNARGNDIWSGYLVVPAQLSKLPESLTQLRVTVPDFLNQSRLLSNGRYGAVLKEMGVGGVASAVRSVLPLLPQEKGATFWVAAMGLLSAALHSVPREFQGTLLLHVYLVDFALSLRRFDMVEKMLAMCRRLRPRARVGFHTNMAAEALNILRVVRVPVDEVSALSSPRALNMAGNFEALRRAGVANLTAEVGLAPDVVHRVACERVEYWAHGADAVLLGPGADDALIQFRRRRSEQEWSRVFPGLTLPEATL